MEGDQVAVDDVDHVDGRIADVIFFRRHAKDKPDVEQILKGTPTDDVNDSCKLFRAAYMVGIEEAFSAYNQECTKGFMESLVGSQGKYTKLVSTTIAGVRRFLPGDYGNILGLVTPVIQAVATLKRQLKAKNIQLAIPKHKDIHFLALIGGLETSRIFEQQICVLSSDNDIMKLVAYAVKKVMAYAADIGGKGRQLQVNDMVNALFLGEMKDSGKLETTVGLSLFLEKIFTHCGLRRWENNSWRYYYKSPAGDGKERSRPSKYGYRGEIVRWPDDNNQEANKDSRQIDEENSTPSAYNVFQLYQSRFILVSSSEWQKYMQNGEFETSFNDFVKSEKQVDAQQKITSVFYQKDVTDLSNKLCIPDIDEEKFPDFSKCHLYFLKRDWFVSSTSTEEKLNLQNLKFNDAHLINGDLSQVRLLNIQGCNLSFCDLSKSDISEFKGSAIFNFCKLNGCEITKDTHNDKRSDFSNCKGESSLVLKDVAAEKIHQILQKVSELGLRDETKEKMKEKTTTQSDSSTDDTDTSRPAVGSDRQTSEEMIDLDEKRKRRLADGAAVSCQETAVGPPCEISKEDATLVRAVPKTDIGDTNLGINSLQIKPKFYDAAIIHSGNPEDIDTAQMFHDEIQENVTLSNGEKPRVYLRAHDAMFGTGKVEEAARAVENSTFKFVICSQHLTADRWSNLSKNEAIRIALEDPTMEWSVIPVVSDDGPLPFGLSSLIPVKLHKKGPTFWKKMNNLFDDKINVR